MTNLNVNIAGIQLKNPIMPASGCYGFGEEFMDKYDLDILGALVVKSTTLEERKGNPEPKYFHSGEQILNSVGLKNPGVQGVLENKLPALKKYDVPIIQSVAGSSVDDYVEAVHLLSAADNVRAIELNISCPNVKQGGLQFGTDPQVAADITRKCKAVTDLPLFVKLTPNVTDITVIAKAVEEAGADAITMINTITGQSFDLASRQPVLGGITGGLSGVALKYVALRMVRQVAGIVDIPIIGVGGIESVDDVLEMLVAGASAVQIGSANYANPYICQEIIEALPQRMKELDIESIESLIDEMKTVIKK